MIKEVRRRGAICGRRLFFTLDKVNIPLLEQIIEAVTATYNG